MANPLYEAFLKHPEDAHTAPEKTEKAPDVPLPEQEVLIALVRNYLCSPNPPKDEDIPPELQDSDAFREIVDIFMALRKILVDLARGSLEDPVQLRGFMGGNLKALQANLRHLTWQAEQVANGDFTQKVAFLGSFSKAFNRMVTCLKENHDQLVMREQRFWQQANHDTLTGLPNRLLAEDRLMQHIALAQRADQCVAVMLIDMDEFKLVNDTFGHIAGDNYLKEVARRLQSSMRATDTAARIGGDEFIVVLSCESPHKRDTAEEIVKRIYASFAKPLDEPGASLPLIRASIGIAFYPEDGYDWETLLESADIAMYRAKESGGDRYEFFEE